MRPLYVGSTNLIELTGLQDTTDNSYPATATVVCDLFDAAGVLVAGASAVAMPFVAGTSGASSKYRGVIPAAVALVVAAYYTARVTATDAGGNVRIFPLPCRGVLE